MRCSSNASNCIRHIRSCLCNSSAVEAQHALSAYDLHNLWHVRGMKQCFGMGHLGHSSYLVLSCLVLPWLASSWFGLPCQVFCLQSGLGLMHLPLVQSAQASVTVEPRMAGLPLGPEDWVVHGIDCEIGCRHLKNVKCHQSQ